MWPTWRLSEVRHILHTAKQQQSALSFCHCQSSLFKFTGRPERLEYAIDSYGNLCGTKNDWDGTNGPDLTLKPKLYYLNPLELLNPATITTAKAICVEACPTATDVCGVANFPCRTAAQYRSGILTTL